MKTWPSICTAPPSHLPSAPAGAGSVRGRSLGAPPPPSRAAEIQEEPAERARPSPARLWLRPHIGCGSGTHFLSQRRLAAPLAPGGSSFCSFTCPLFSDPAVLSFWNHQINLGPGQLAASAVRVLPAGRVGAAPSLPSSSSPTPSPERPPVCVGDLLLLPGSLWFWSVSGSSRQHLILCRVSTRFRHVSFEAVHEGPAVCGALRQALRKQPR